MLDIRFIRENAELVQRKSQEKGYAVNIVMLLEQDDKRRELIAQIETLQEKRNVLASQFKNQKPTTDQAEQGRKIKDKITELNIELDKVEMKFIKELKNVPNMPADDVPVGASEAENVVAKEWGDKPQFGFEPKSHWQIAEARGLIDKERAAKVVGARFAYIKGELVRLQFAIIQFAMDTLTDEETIKKIIQENDLINISPKPFIPVLPPLMLRTEVYDAMDRLEPREERYKVGEDNDGLWLQGSAEHTLGPMHMNERLELEALPLRYIGYATSFRREAGSYGKDTEGIVRMHQFDKLEMESFVNPQGGPGEHLFFVAVQEYLMQQLKIPYRVLQKCTADIGKPNARGIDIEAWLPGVGRYLETHTADYMTDYQARRLNTKAKTIPPPGVVLTYDYNNPPTDFVHTNDATAFALGRTMVAIIENYQTQDGKVRIPDALKPYMGNRQEI